MCKAMEDMRNEALEQGRMEGRMEEHFRLLIETVRNIKADLGLSDQQIKNMLKISAEDWKLIAAQI